MPATATRHTYTHDERQAAATLQHPANAYGLTCLVRMSLTQAADLLSRLQEDELIRPVPGESSPSRYRLLVPITDLARLMPLD